MKGEGQFEYKGEDLNKAEVGEKLGPIEYTLTPKEIEDYAHMVEDYNPWFLHNSPFGGPIAHPTVGAIDYAKLISTRYSLYGVVHTKAAHEFLSPLRPGKSYKVSGKIVDRYSKKGHEYLVLESVTTDEDGVEVVRSRNTVLIS